MPSSDPPGATPDRQVDTDLLSHRHALGWSLGAAAWTALASAASFAHQGREALTCSLLAAVAFGIGWLHRYRAGSNRMDRDASPPVGLRRWQQGWRQASSAEVSLLGLAAALFAFSALTPVRRWGEIRLPGDLLLAADGAIDMAWSLGAVCALLATWRMFVRPAHAGRRVWPWAVLGGAAVLLLGPRLEVVHSSYDHPRHLSIKRSVLDVLDQPWSRSAWIERGEPVQGEPPGGAEPLCLALERRAWLFWERQVPWRRQGATAQPCGATAEAALASGEAAEAELLRGDLDRYFERVLRDPDLLLRGVGLPPSRLPAHVRGPLLALRMTREPEPHYSALDLALALRRSKDVQALQPFSPPTSAHQHLRLFEMGLPLTVPSTSSIVQPAVLTEEAHGLTRLDFAVANRSCHVAFAQHLVAQGLTPDVGPVLHLLLLMGRAQHPNASAEEFVGVDDELGYPDAKQLPHCVELARFYGTQVGDLQSAHDPSDRPQDTPLGRVYAIAASVVRLWLVGEYDRRDGKVDAAVVVGEPEWSVEAAAAALAAQPASFEQFCLWARDAAMWSLYPASKRPGLAASMRALAQSWKGKPVEPKASRAECLIPTPMWVADNELPAWGRSLNAQLRQVAMPCQARPRDKASGFQSPELICEMTVAVTE